MAFIALHMFGSPPPVPGKSGRRHRFAVLICARNEETVIGELIGSLQQQDYPADLFDVFVVADNCTDHTADAPGPRVRPCSNAMTCSTRRRVTR